MVKNARVYLRESRQPLTEAKLPDYIKALQKAHKNKDLDYYIDDKKVDLDTFITRINTAAGDVGLRLKGDSWDRLIKGEKVLMPKDAKRGTAEFTYRAVIKGTNIGEEEAEKKAEEEARKAEEEAKKKAEEEARKKAEEEANRDVHDIIVTKDSKLELVYTKNKKGFERFFFRIDGKDALAFDSLESMKSTFSTMLKKAGKINAQTVSDEDNAQSSSSDMGSDGADFVEESFRVRRKR